jgi:WD40 repeat protein
MAFAFRPEELSEPLDDKLYVWDRQGNHHAITGHTAHEEYVQAAVFSPTGEKWASGDYDGRLYVWDRQGTQPKDLTGHTASIEALAFAPDGKCLVSASNDGTVRIWNVGSGEELSTLSLTQLDAERYSGDLYHKQELIRQQHERREQEDKPSRPEIGAIAFSPRGDIVAIGLYGEIRLWDVTTYEIRRAILPPLTCRRQFALAFSPCGYYLASGTWWDDTEKVSIRLWEVTTGENIATFWGHPTDIQDLAFSPDGTLLASGSFDGTLLLWDMIPYLQNETS